MIIRPEDDLRYILDCASPNSVIELAPGEYRVKLSVHAPGITLRGAGRDRTVIVWDDYAKKPDFNGTEMNTFRTWTVGVFADGVTMEDLAIVNASGSPEKLGQEVALSVYADGFTMRRCRLASTQDTLFLGPLPDDLIERYDGFLQPRLRERRRCRQRFEDCLVEGSVDFIFGCGEAVFERCEIRSVSDVRGVGYAAAPSHELRQTEGFLFRDCDFTAEDAVEDGSIYLARPWRDYGISVFENCRYGSHIAEVGFDKWNDTERDKTARFYESPAVPGRQPWINR